MDRKISIDFLGGAHGHFLRQILNAMFYQKDFPFSHTLNRTWHSYADVTSGEYPRDIHYNPVTGPDVQCSHIWEWFLQYDAMPREEFLATHFPKPAVNHNVISITVPSLLSKAIVNMHWARGWDSFPFTPGDLLGKSSVELAFKWSTSMMNHVDTSIDRSAGAMLNRRQTYLYVMSKIFRDDEKNQIDCVNETDLITCWASLRGYLPETIKYLSISSDRLRAAGHHVIEFDMMWLYNEEESLRSLKKIGEIFHLGEQLLTDDEVCAIIRRFIATVHELPNFQRVNTAFSNFVAGTNSSLAELSLNDKIALWGMVLIHFDLLSSYRYLDYRLHSFPNTINELISITSQWPFIR